MSAKSVERHSMEDQSGHFVNRAMMGHTKDVSALVNPWKIRSVKGAIPEDKRSPGLASMRLMKKADLAIFANLCRSSRQL